MKTLLKNSAISKTIIVTVGTFTGSIFAYLLQVFLGRSLSIEDFGTFTALLALSVIFGVVVTTAMTSIIKLVSKLSVQGKYDTLTHLFVELSLGIVGIGFLLFLGVAGFRAPLADFLGMTDTTLFYYFGLYLGVSFLLILPNAYLQGFLRFKAFSFFTVLFHFLRFSFPLAAVYLGFGLKGVFIGLGLSMVVAYLIGILLLRKNFTVYEKKSLRSHYKNVLTFAGAILFVQMGMTLLNNVDVILVKHYFDSVSAGLYAGLITVGKVLLFGASTVGVVMFPLVSTAYDKNEDYLEKFRPLLILQVAVVIVGIFVFNLFPEEITKLMFGASYLPSAKFLPKFSFFVGAYVLINFMILFFLAIEKVKVFLFLIPAIAAQIFLISLFHNSIVNIVNVNLAVSASLLFGVVLYFKKNVSLSYSSSLQAGKNNKT